MTIDEILAKVADGSMQPAEAGAAIKTTIAGVSRPAPEDEGYSDFALQRVADKDDAGYDQSFNKVTAAWIGGSLSDGQYHTIREAVVPALKKENSDE